MRKIFAIAAIAAVILLVQCEKEKDPEFLISKDSVGKLERSNVVSELEGIYAADSLVIDSIASDPVVRTGKIQIYETGGAHLLTLTASEDSVQRIENIRIQDPRFITNKGIGLGSSFKDIRDNYQIRKVVTSMNNVVIFLKDSDVYFTIDKEELPASLRYSTNNDIDAVQIPDLASIKYMMIGWE